MARRSHQSSVIGPDLCCDWLISLICNHYCRERQLWQGKKRDRIIQGGEKRHHRGCPVTSLPRHNARNQAATATHAQPHTHRPKACEETPSKEQSFTGNYILKINRRTRQEPGGGVVRTWCQRVSHISSGNGFCSATAAREATPAPVRGGIRAGY